jgi:perosamine synthetase
MVPKQIIYPLRYLSPFFRSDADRYERHFAERFRQLLQAKHFAQPIGRARAGIYLLVKLLVQPGREKVLLSPYTIPDLVNMVTFAGGQPIFVDFEPKSTDVSLEHLSQLIDDQTAAVIVTHYHVNQSQFAELLQLCDSKGAALIEDCAISLGGTIDGHCVGTQSTGGVFSLSSYKFLNYFWGGAIYCKDSNLQARVDEQVNSWSRLRAGDYRGQILRTLKYDLATRPLPYRWITAPLLRFKQRRSGEVQVIHQPRIESDQLDASLLSRPSAGALAEWGSKANQVKDKLAHRRRIAEIYHQRLGDLAVGRFSSDALESGCFVNYPIWVGAERRDRMYKSLILQGIDVGLSLYPNVHEHPKFSSLPGQSEQVSQLVRSVLSLPCHPRVSGVYAKKVADAVKNSL